MRTFCLILCAYAVVIVCSASTGMCRHSWLRTQNEQEVCFCKPSSTRVTGALLALMLIAGPAWLLWETDVAYRTASDAQANFALSNLYAAWLFFFIAVGVAQIGFWMASPQEISLDFRQRVYRVISGWASRKRVGSLDELTGIYVIYVGGKARTHLVKLAWVQTRQWPMTASPPCLGQFPRKNEAIRFAEDMAGRLELPVVAAPRQDW